MSLKGFKTKIDPNNEQRTMFAQHAGCARVAWNWGLDIYFQTIEARRKAEELGIEKPKWPTAIDLHKRLNAEVKPEKKWFYKSSKCAPQEALRNLDKAWKRRFKVAGSGVPKRKKKYQNDSFYLEGNIQVKDGFIRLPVIGLVRLHEKVENQAIKSVTVSRKADDWFVSWKIEYIPMTTVKCFGRIGVDLGVKTLATLSDGKVFPSIKPYRQNKSRVARIQRKMSRQKLGGKNRDRTKRKLAKLHARIANIRNDATHKLTSYLTKNHSQIVIEDLNVRGMLKNHKLASAIADSGFYEFKRQLQYKADFYGSEVIVIDRFYPSSQLCSNCGHRQSMPLQLRTYDCGGCSSSIDRDLNAAINICNYPDLAVSYTVSACQTEKGLGAQERPLLRKEAGIKPLLLAMSNFV